MKMTAREVIEQLETIARDLPDGLDTHVIVMLCDGDDATASRELDIDTLTWVSKTTGVETGHAAMIRGHPHIDRGEGRGTRYPAAAGDVDEVLREWTEGGDR